MQKTWMKFKQVFDKDCFLKILENGQSVIKRFHTKCHQKIPYEQSDVSECLACRHILKLIVNWTEGVIYNFNHSLRHSLIVSSASVFLISSCNSIRCSTRFSVEIYEQNKGMRDEQEMSYKREEIDLHLVFHSILSSTEPVVVDLWVLDHTTTPPHRWNSYRVFP